MATELHEFRLPITTAPDLRDFLWYAFGVRIPDKAVCPGHTAPWTIFCDSYFNRHRVQVVKASRGLAGKTFLFAHLGLVQALTQRAHVTLLGGSAQQSKLLHDYMVAAWNHPGAPTQCLRSDPTQMETRFANGATIRALTAAPTSIRGPHPEKLVIDEADECEWSVLTAALGQPMSRDGIPAGIVISSTHHYPTGTFTEVLKLAAEKSWVVREFCYRETLQPHGWLDPAEVEAKRTDVPAAMWDIEYELQQPSAEDRAIMPESVGAMFDEQLGRAEGRNREYLEFEAPIPGAAYSTGADWAKSRDWTVIVTLRTDVSPARVVAYERMQRLPWPAMVERFDARLRRYPGTSQYDQTGLGDVVGGYLTERSHGVQLVGRLRAELFSSYINLVEQGKFQSPMITPLYADHAYCRVTDLFGSGHPPDGLVAMALATIWCGKHWTWAPVGE